MILVDSSAWIDYFRGTITPQTGRLDALLGVEPLATGDLVLAEVLQGFRRDREFELALRLLSSLDIVAIGGTSVAIQAARHCRVLRERGVAARKAIDTIIATRCIVDGYSLLYSDRDFDPFVEHLGLRSAMTDG